MKKIKTIFRPAVMAVTLAVILSAGSLLVWAAPQPSTKTPVEITADSIDYDSASGLMQATGEVRITQGTAVITAEAAVYNTKSQEGHLTGGVNAVNQDATLTADEVKTYKNNTQLIALGGAVLTNGDSRLSGPTVEYNSETQYALVPANGKIEMNDGTMTANKIEAFIAENRAIGVGSVHIISAVRKLDATADMATYYGQPKGQSKVILSGNARVLQDGNVLTGELLTLRLDEKAAEAQGGRPKLTIISQ